MEDLTRLFVVCGKAAEVLLDHVATATKGASKASTKPCGYFAGRHAHSRVQLLRGSAECEIGPR